MIFVWIGFGLGLLPLLIIPVFHFRQMVRRSAADNIDIMQSLLIRVDNY